MNETCNQIISLLLDRNHSLSYHRIYFELIDVDKRHLVEVAKKQLERMKIIEMELDADGKETYTIPYEIKEEIKYLPRQFENKPYEYFRDKQQKITETENITKWYLQQDAKQRYDDYPKVVNEKRITIFISVLAIIVTIVIAIATKGKC